MNPVTEFTEGENTFRVIPIIMRERDADLLISELKEKEEKGGMITKEDLVPLMFCSLMGGKMAQKDRMKAAFRLTQQATHVSEEEIRKIEAVLYAMADKFLEKEELGELVEEISMTKLGEMLVNKGMNQGISQAKLEDARNLLDVLNAQTIAERIGLPLETVQQLEREKAKTS